MAVRASGWVSRPVASSSLEVRWITAGSMSASRPIRVGGTIPVSSASSSRARALRIRCVTGSDRCRQREDRLPERRAGPDLAVGIELLPLADRDQVLGQRADQERVAPAGRVAGGQQGRAGPTAELLVEQVADAVPGQGSQPQSAGGVVEQVGIEGRLGRLDQVPTGRDHQNPGRAGAPAQIDQAAQRARVYMVQVVDADQYRGPAAQLKQAAVELLHDRRRAGIWRPEGR